MTMEAEVPGRVKVDVVVRVEVDLREPDQTVIRTNVRHEMVKEILSEWVSAQMFRSKPIPYQPAADGFKFTITIGLRIADDVYGHESDCGNHGLEVGIIMDVINRLPKLTMTDLPPKAERDPK